MSKKSLLVLVLLLFALGNALAAAAQRVVSTTPIGPIWQKQRAALGPAFGYGLALSLDGKAVVYLGIREGDAENSMFLAETATGKETLLQGPRDVFMPMDPSFSPDGKRIVFVLVGTSWSYPADIYTVSAEADGLRKLTESVSCTERPVNERDGYRKCRYYQRYYYSPRYSPDGSLLLLHVYDVAEQIRHFSAMMNADGSDLQILAEGKPAGWSADSKAVYYTHKGFLTRMELETRATRTVPLPAVESRTPLGRMKGRDWFAFRLGNGRIGWYDFETATPVPQFLGEWSVPGVKMAGRERLELKGFDWSRLNEVLLWYQGEETERFEVVRIFDPTALSR